MRKAINENLLVQVGLVGILALIIGFFLLTRMGGGSEEAPAPAVPQAADGTAEAAAGADAAAAPNGASAAGAQPSTADAGAVSPAPGAGLPAGVGEFVAGPGLPAAVVKAHEDSETVVLLITRRAGIEDRALRGLIERVRGRDDVALFTATALDISRYARITQGVNVNRVPALVVIHPERKGDEAPVAAVSYGFRSSDSIAQALRDAVYKGPDNLPFFPR